MMGIATWVFCMQRKLPLLSGVAGPLIMTADVVSLASFLHSSLAAIMQTPLVNRRDAVLALMRAGHLAQTA